MNTANNTGLSGSSEQQKALGLEPPDCGEMQLSFDFAPVSLQAPKNRREVLSQTVRSVAKTADFLLSGDVQIDIEWYLHEQDRYESDLAPDVDNILKSLLDGLSGPEGIMVDDTQVQAISCDWVDWSLREQRVIVRARFDPDEWLPKNNVAFVHLGNALYVPINDNIDREGMLLLLDTLGRMFSARKELLEQSEDYYLAKRVMPIQRVFHKSRLRDFKLVELSELRRQCNEPETPPTP